VSRDQLLLSYDKDGRDVMCLFSGWALIVARSCSGPCADARMTALKAFYSQEQPHIEWVEGQLRELVPEWITIWKGETLSIEEWLRAVSRAALIPTLPPSILDKKLGPELPLRLLASWHSESNGWKLRISQAEAFERIWRAQRKRNGFVLHAAWAQLMKFPLKKILKITMQEEDVPSLLDGISLGEQFDTVEHAQRQACTVIPDWVLNPQLPPRDGQVTAGNESAHPSWCA